MKIGTRVQTLESRGPGTIIGTSALLFLVEHDTWRKGNNGKDVVSRLDSGDYSEHKDCRCWFYYADVLTPLDEEFDQDKWYYVDYDGSKCLLLGVKKTEIYYTAKRWILPSGTKSTNFAAGLKNIKEIRLATNEELIAKGLIPAGHTFKIGDKVITNQFDTTPLCTFVKGDMEKYVGRTGKIIDISGKGNIQVHGWFWPPSAVTHVVKQEQPVITAAPTRMVYDAAYGYSDLARFKIETIEPNIKIKKKKPLKPINKIPCLNSTKC